MHEDETLLDIKYSLRKCLANVYHQLVNIVSGLAVDNNVVITGLNLDRALD